MVWIARLVARAVHRLAPGLRFQARALQRHGEARKEHPSRGHLVDQGVQPFGEQQLVVRRLAGKLDALERAHRGGIRHCGGKRERRLLEGFGFRRAEATHADVGAVLEVLPAALHDQSHYKKGAAAAAPGKTHPSLGGGRKRRAGGTE